MSHGTAYGAHLLTGGYSRLELNADHAFSITDASSPVSSDCTDAAEFQPAMNLSGGSAASLWYDGQYLTASSLSFRPEGRPAPDAFVYGAAD